MKKLLYILPLLGIMISCGGNKEENVDKIIASKDVKAIQQKRVELSKQLKITEQQIADLDNAIKELDPQGKNTLVSIYTVKDTIFNHYLDIQATVQTEKNILLNAEYSGILENIYVKKGQQVSKGQLLAKIEDGGISQQLSQLEVQAELAKTTFERQSRLWKEKIGSEIQYLQAKSNYERSKSAVAQMKQQMAKTTITAPFSGTIDDILTDAGTAVNPGSPIIRLVNLSDMYLEAEVPEQHINNIKKGTQAKVEIPVLGKTFETKVHQTSSVINPNNRSFRVDILLPNQNKEIRPNMTARVQVKDYDNEKAILLPLDVISENADGEQYVYVAEPQDDHYIAKKATIKTGITQDGMIEILEGLKEGDHIIKEGGRSVREGQIISISNL